MSVRCPDCGIVCTDQRQLDLHWDLRHKRGGSAHWCSEHPVHPTDVLNPTRLRLAIDAAKELRDLALAADLLNDVTFPTARKERADALVRYLEGLHRG